MYFDKELLERRKETIRNHKGKLAAHFKGRLYLVIDVAINTETGEELVIYKAMYGNYLTYARPIDMFASPVDKEKYPGVKQEFRFELINK